MTLDELKKDLADRHNKAMHKKMKDYELKIAMAISDKVFHVILEMLVAEETRKIVGEEAEKRVLFMVDVASRALETARGSVLLNFLPRDKSGALFLDMNARQMEALINRIPHLFGSTKQKITPDMIKDIRENQKTEEDDDE